MAEEGPQTVLITGGSGYFGSLLLHKLLARGARCRVLDLNDACDRPAEVEFVQADIRDYKAIRRACEDIDSVHHNVAQVPLAKNRRLFRSVNIDGVENLLKAASEAGVKKVVHTSSSAVYGVPKANPVTEETPPRPQEDYGQAKYEAEMLCHRYAQQGLDVSIIRPRTIMGHGRLGIFQILFEWIHEGANVPVFGRGDNIYQFVHADDLAEACILAAARPGPATYNCGADRFGTMREVLESLCEHAGTGSKVKSLPMAPAVAAMKVTSALGLSPLCAYHALMYGQSMYFDTTKARRDLRWSPSYSNNDMFIESYEWYLANRNEVRDTSDVSLHRRPVKQGILRPLKWVL
jgi:nucleoside-diphosphate-sugar epimerase